MQDLIVAIRVEYGEYLKFIGTKTDEDYDELVFEGECKKTGLDCYMPYDCSEEIGDGRHYFVLGLKFPETSDEYCDSCAEYDLKEIEEMVGEIRNALKDTPFKDYPIRLINF